ncbi:MAG: amino acid permease [Acetobacteraceae bacterium]|nr:amino acid permease [Acetobacteraceae bacterium]
MAGTDAPTPLLRRVLTFWPLVFYGLAVIVGAGIYVALGAVVRRAGEAAPLSFLLAGVTAGLTGLCYAELAGRFPEASGGVAYVRHGYGSNRLAQIVGAMIAASVAIAAASIALGSVHYLVILVPIVPPVMIVAMVGGFTLVAMLGVRESVGLAAVMGVLEIAGLIAATVNGLLIAPDFNLGGIWPSDLQAWRGVVAGAFIAFFAFIGFETLANLAEEVKEPQRTLPRGIVTAIALSVVIYVAVATAAVLADRQGETPLLDLFEGPSATVFAAIGGIAVANGVLVQIVMLGRLFYGMARNGQLPEALGVVHPRTATPMRATLLAGAIILAVALLVPFEHLLLAANAMALSVFVLVDIALLLVHRRGPAMPGAFSIPHWIPYAAALLSATLLLAAMIGVG